MHPVILDLLIAVRDNLTIESLRDIEGTSKFMVEVLGPKLDRAFNLKEDDITHQDAELLNQAWAGVSQFAMGMSASRNTGDKKRVSKALKALIGKVS